MLVQGELLGWLFWQEAGQIQRLPEAVRHLPVNVLLRLDYFS
jgi:hypothetical protein